MASLTTFHLPHRGAADPVWKKYFPGTPDDRFLFEALRRERVALQRHARKSGCWLILDPVERLENVYRRHGPSSVRARVSGLLHFLRDDSLPDVVVAINDDAERMSSVTLVGDWFSSEAVSSGGKRVIREAFFTRDALTVRQQIARKGPSTFWHPRNVGGPIVPKTRCPRNSSWRSDEEPVRDFIRNPGSQADGPVCSVAYGCAEVGSTARTAARTRSTIADAFWAVAWSGQNSMS